MRTILTVLLMLLCHSSTIGLGMTMQEINNQLALLTPEKRAFLDHFFRTLVQRDSLGYVLLGTKPICFSGYFATIPLGNLLWGDKGIFLKKGWHIWQKIAQDFPHPHYIIFEEITKTKDLEMHNIFFIKKTQTLKALQKHKTLFQRVLGQDFSPLAFLECHALLQERTSCNPKNLLKRRLSTNYPTCPDKLRAL